MRRHVVVGRFGTSDTLTIPRASDEVETALNLVNSDKVLSHGVGGALDHLSLLGVYPSEITLDLLVLAALVHLADTRISRETESQDSWTREMRLVVPVSDPSRWAMAEPVLKQILDFLTGDLWTIGFRARPKGFGTMIPARLGKRNQPVFDSLSLFSGGLDSLIGAVDLLEQGSTPLLVSHAAEGATSDAQNACFDALKAHYSTRPFERLRVWMSFPEGVVREGGSEKTTRGRSFLFLTLGVLAGAGFAQPFTLRVPENGLIALNVPLDLLRLGSHSTRTTHPFYLERWNELLRVVGIPGRVENPYWNKTKGEMVAGCANPELLKNLVPRSLSCSSPTKGRWQGRGIEHCGYCLPCLIRRAAIEAAWGRGKDITQYTMADLRAHTLDTRQAEGQQVRSFQFAIARLKARPGLEKFLIHKPGPLGDDPNRLNALADVYRRGMIEVGALLENVHAAPS